MSSVTVTSAATDPDAQACVRCCSSNASAFVISQADRATIGGDRCPHQQQTLASDQRRRNDRSVVDADVVGGQVSVIVIQRIKLGDGKG